jgi:hypothetical protein
LLGENQNLSNIDLQVQADQCSTCTRALAVAEHSRLSAFAHAASEECIAKHTAAEKVVQRCMLQVEMYEDDLLQARLIMEKAQQEMELLKAYVGTCSDLAVQQSVAGHSVGGGKV